MRNEGYVRNYASVIRLLASRGHDVIVGSRGPERHMSVSTEAFLQALSRECPRAQSRILPRRADEWISVASRIRALRNALRYRDPAFRSATKLARRAFTHLEKHAPGAVPLATRAPWRVARLSMKALAALERAVPPAAAIDEVIAATRPDIVLVTPLVDFNSFQIDYLKSARAAGIPTGLLVASWDNLTNKGVVAVPPDRVFVWNEAQRAEAVRFHGIPGDHVDVTGAQLFDDWFDRAPSTNRADFATRVGLEPGRAFVLYLCSSLFIAPNEIAFVRRWLQAIRAADDPVLRACGVLVRPHPGHAGPWAGADLGEGVAIWPRAGALPIEESGKADYFDSLYHASAVVGVNTSGIIEAAILGKMTFTVRDPDFAATQDRTLHYHHVKDVLIEAEQLGEHVRQLADTLRAPAQTSDRTRRFVETFVRPHGLERPATPILADAVERLAAERRERARLPRSTTALQRLLKRTLPAPAGVTRSVARAGEPARPGGARRT